MTRAVRLWLLLTAAAILITLAVQWILRERDPLWVLPVSQSLSLSATWIIAWPLWFRHRPNQRFGFLGHSLIMLLTSTLVAATKFLGLAKFYWLFVFARAAFNTPPIAEADGTGGPLDGDARLTPRHQRRIDPTDERGEPAHRGRRVQVGPESTGLITFSGSRTPVTP
jgi:hypothetical protein